MENLNELKPVGKLSPFAHFCCTIGNLPTSYMISLTYEEQLLWLCNYLEKTVIPAVNTNAEAVAELQSLYNKLKEYVDNYFDNLDVQNEINVKLDEMAQDGTLDNIINKNIFNDLNNKIDTLSAEIGQYDIIVAKDGSGDYSTLTEAVNNANNGQSIFVKNGIYNDEVVNCVGKYLILVGESKENTIIQNNYDDYSRAPLIIGKGIVKNLSFKQIGKSETTEIKSYAVHIDNPDLFNNELHFTNCYFYSLTHASVGVGLYNNCQLIFTSCEFRSDHFKTPQNEHRGALFIHSSNNIEYAGNNQICTIDNCKLSTKYGSVIHFESCLDLSNMATFIAYNSDIYSDELGIQSGLITQELNASASEFNIILSNKNGGNNYPTLNASKYQQGVGYVNVIGKFNGNNIENEMKRFITNININAGQLLALPDIPYDIKEICSITGGLKADDGTFFPLSHNGDNVGNNITVWINPTTKNLSCYSYLKGTITAIIDYV